MFVNDAFSGAMTFLTPIRQKAAYRIEGWCRELAPGNIGPRGGAMRIELLALCIAVSVSGTVASCGVSAPDEAVITGTSNWPSCSWPAALDDPDKMGSSRDRCVATRTRLSCALPGGATEICATDDPLQCEHANAPPPEACHAACGRNEFAATCGGVGPSGGPGPAPPAGCRFEGLVPGGLTYYCCPCGA